jgi:pimeloyl-ACP methyl ester carboxylesterase/DNA-binding CsgD family transcriptional regulator
MPPALPPIQYATASDGVRIAYISVGEGAPLVFASNIFGDATRYLKETAHVREVTDRLARLGYRVVRYDHRGMGASDRGVDDVGLEARVRDLSTVVEQLGLDHFALAAVDVGGATAIAYVVEHAAAVSRLALVSPWASGARYLQLPALRAALSVQTSGDQEWKLFANILKSVASGFKDPEQARGAAEFFLQTTSPAAFSAFNAASAGIDVTSLLPRVAIPTLVTHEPGFQFGSFELCQEVAAAIPCAEFVIVDENSIAGRQHDETVAVLDRFLRRGTRMGAAPIAHARAADAGGLTPREVEVLRHVAAGATNKEIAGSLSLAVSTVERHLVNIYTKIAARGRADAIGYALRHGLGDSAR